MYLKNKEKKKEEMCTNMSDRFVYTDVGAFYPSKKNEKTNDKSKNKVIKLVVLLLCLVLLIEAFIYFMVIPSISRVSLEFMNTSPALESDLKKQLSSLSFQNWFEFDSSYALSLISENSSVDAVKITKRAPNRVIISIKERIPVAFTLIQEKGKTKTYYLDKNGVLFQNNNTSVQQNLPLLSGLDITNVKETHRLNSRDRRILDQIVTIQQSKPEYLSVLSEIAISKKDNGSFDLLLYPLYSRVKIITDRLLNEESLQSMLVTLDVMKKINPQISELDLRHGSISFKY
ncbi:MAG: FtsQ-type POTRA domain-containing protein [Spirochaetaceae bacterium]|nr:FtsQ-type POTRA domain-containing protein [Spirochaetaceae bacterium]